MKQRPSRLLAILILTVTVAACGGDDGPSSSTAATPSGPSPVPTTGAAVASCSPSVEGVPISVPGAGGRYTLTVSTASSCTWSIQSDAAWASVAPSSGQGAGSTVLVVEANTAVDNTRSANLTAGSQQFHFSQANACTYRLEYSASDVGFDGGTFSINLVTRDGCAWKASSTEKWLRPTPTSGSGSEAVEVDVDANPGGERHATLTIAGLRVTVIQRGR